MDDLHSALVELVRRASTDLPPDVEHALSRAFAQEEPCSPAASALDSILKNVALARSRSTPMCQDTGIPIFTVSHPSQVRPHELQQAIERAVARATELAFLRPNAVDPLSGRNSGDNVGCRFPSVYFEEWKQEYLRVDLLLKGGGSENVSAQYALPYAPLSAGRDLEGVRRVVLDALVRAQGRGCAPGVLGITIGGDRGNGYALAKRQLHRPLDDVNPMPQLAELEQQLSLESNELGIGPMGFGGRTTVLGVKIGICHRLPACYFVTVAYMCWACRRASLIYQGSEWRIEQ
jgi:fumarate hydratase, class I